MKKTSIFLFLLMLSVSAFSQIQFSQFKFGKDSPMGCCPGRKMIKAKFKNTSGKDFKYVKIHYYAVNAVGDVISGVEQGITRKGKEFIKPKVLSFTGPIAAGKQQSGYGSGVITTSLPDVVAMPYQIEIIYMDSNEKELIDIDENNIGKFFPKVEWRAYERYNETM